MRPREAAFPGSRNHSYAVAFANQFGGSCPLGKVWGLQMTLSQLRCGGVDWPYVCEQNRFRFCHAPAPPVAIIYTPKP